MFRKTDPQTSLLESHHLLPPSKRARLEKSWSQVFNVHVLPLIDEELFRAALVHGSGDKTDKQPSRCQRGDPRVQVACQPGVLVVKERVEEG